jgi:ferredoxin-thioredoxin reductase catalytic chain
MIKEEFKPKDSEELVKLAEDYAKKKEMWLNPDKEKLAMIIKGLMKNKEKHGEVYCPCRLVTGNKEKDRDIICPCVFHRGEVEIQGNCRCQLFFGNKS